MKKVIEDEKKKGKINLLHHLKDWELITKKIEELNVPEKTADEIKKSIFHKDAELSRLKYF